MSCLLLLSPVLCRVASHGGQGLALPTSPSDTGSQPSPPSPHLGNREGIPKRVSSLSGWPHRGPDDSRTRMKGSFSPFLTCSAAISLQLRSVTRLQKSGLRVLARASSLGRRGERLAVAVGTSPRPSPAHDSGTRLVEPRRPQHLEYKKTTPGP